MLHLHFRIQLKFAFAEQGHLWMPIWTLRNLLWTHDSKSSQERHRSLDIPYLRGAHGVRVVYDVRNKRTYREVELTTMALNYMAKEAKIMPISNKADTGKERQVSTYHPSAYASSEGRAFIVR